MILLLPAQLVQTKLAALDGIGATLLVPEQFAIADSDYLLNAGRTRSALDWVPTRRDADILFAAFTASRDGKGAPAHT